MSHWHTPPTPGAKPPGDNILAPVAAAASGAHPCRADVGQRSKRTSLSLRVGCGVRVEAVLARVRLLYVRRRRYGGQDDTLSSID